MTTKAGTGAKSRRTRTLTACPPKPPLAQRPLLSAQQSRHLTSIFKVLANDTRLRLLHALVRKDELCVNDLADAVGMKAQAVSNQLQRLAAQGIVGATRKGNQVFYRIEDPCVTLLLDHGLCLAEDAEPRMASAPVGCA